MQARARPKLRGVAEVGRPSAPGTSADAPKVRAPIPAAVNNSRRVMPLHRFFGDPRMRSISRSSLRAVVSAYATAKRGASQGDNLIRGKSQILDETAGSAYRVLQSTSLIRRRGQCATSTRDGIDERFMAVAAAAARLVDRLVAVDRQLAKTLAGLSPRRLGASRSALAHWRRRMVTHRTVAIHLAIGRRGRVGDSCPVLRLASGLLSGDAG